MFQVLRFSDTHFSKKNKLRDFAQIQKCKKKKDSVLHSEDFARFQKNEIEKIV